MQHKIFWCGVNTKFPRSEVGCINKACYLHCLPPSIFFLSSFQQPLLPDHPSTAPGSADKADALEDREFFASHDSGFRAGRLCVTFFSFPALSSFVSDESLHHLLNSNSATQDDD
jgi:hypothetical protein